MREKVVVLGAKGMLGSELVNFLEIEGDKDVIGLDLEDIDLRDEKRLEVVLEEQKADFVVNCAGVTQVDACEDEKKVLAIEVNGDVPGKIAVICKRKKIRFIHISTDYVFSAKEHKPILEETPTNPCNFYGKTKERGEKAIEEVGGDYLIIRTAWLYGVGGNNFVKTVFRLAREQEELKIVNDQIGAPTNVLDLAYLITRVLKEKRTNILHITNSGSCSWYEFARKILEYKGIKKEVTAVDSSIFSLPAKRPAYSLLSIKKLQQLTQLKIRSWEEALKHFIDNIEYISTNYVEEKTI